MAERLKGKVEALDDAPIFAGAVEIVTPEGNRLWVVTGPAAVKLVPDGAVYFTGDEIMQLQKAGKDAVGSLIDRQAVLSWRGTGRGASMKRSRFKSKHSEEEQIFCKSVADMVRQVRTAATGRKKVGESSEVKFEKIRDT